jgi:hypothetical protein
MRQKRRFKMNVVTVEKIAFQVADSALVIGAFIGQVAVRHGERLSAILQDQAHQDLQFTRDRLAFDGRNAVREIEFLVDDFQQDAYETLATVFQAVVMLMDLLYYIESFDHEIPLYLEAELKPMNVVQPPQLLLPAPAIAGLLPPASEPVTVAGIPGTPVVTEPQAVELPADWSLDKNGRKLSGAALQARMKKYNLVSA